MTPPRRPEQALTVGVLGAGAVGCYFGARLAQHGVPVTLIARPAHAAAITRDGLIINGVAGTEVVPMAAVSDVAAIARAAVVLVTVKSVDTEATADLIAAHVAPDALVVSLQNGVDNAWRLGARVPNPVVPAVVYVSTEMSGPGVLRHNGSGRLVVGTPLGTGSAAAEAGVTLAWLVARFVAAGVPCARSADVRVDLWTKLAANCAYNAVSALTGLRYAAIAADTEARAVMSRVTDELLAVARADGVPLAAETVHAAVWAIAAAMPGALSSTAQDLQAGRRTEIDALNGFVVQRGRALGVPTPGNQTLLALVRLAEQGRATA